AVSPYYEQKTALCAPVRTRKRDQVLVPFLLFSHCFYALRASTPFKDKICSSERAVILLHDKIVAEPFLLLYRRCLITSYFGSGLT
ncbi:MAG: hypothetical protein ACPGWR_18405, partial [Ardenticatenaceae bacterium]